MEAWLLRWGARQVIRGIEVRCWEQRLLGNLALKLGVALMRARLSVW